MGRVQGALRRNGQERVGHELVMLGSSLMFVHLSEDDDMTPLDEKGDFPFLV